MCGIAGFANLDGAPAARDLIEQMTRAVAHRGPDGEGHYVWNTVALGHRRLAIIDLTEHGHQPMLYQNGDLVLTYNGEIYNYLELRDELVRKGFAFETHSDTEVILAAYACWGKTCVSRFNGMWAFALLDKKKNSLFLSRDRFGVKPLYYRLENGRFSFGSEIRQLLVDQNTRRPNIQNVERFLFMNWSDIDASTFFSDIQKLQPSHNAVIDLASGRIDIRRYYELELNDDVAHLDAAVAIDRLADLLDSSVALRLRSDVKVGTCLSGGLDSSSIATLAARIQRESGADFSFAAITAISEDEALNEASFAEAIVDASRLTWYTTKPSYNDFANDIDALVDTQEEPFGGPSLMMQYDVMKAARAHGVKVLLDGQGGDETLLGYDKYYGSYFWTMWKESGPLSVLRGMGAARRNNANMHPVALMKAVFGAISAGGRYSYHSRENNYLKRIPVKPQQLSDFARFRNDTFALQKLEIESTSLPALLRYEDKNSMAHGIETRLPFLDYRIVEFALSLRNNLKIRDGWMKWILREAMKSRMPPSIIWRRNKFGFEAPTSHWLNLHHDEMKRRIMASPLVQMLTNASKLDAVIQGSDQGAMWRLYSVAMWELRHGVSV